MTFPEPSFTELAAILALCVALILVVANRNRAASAGAIRITGIWLIISMCLFADSPYIYMAGVLIVGTTATTKKFLQNIAAIIRGGGKTYFKTRSSLKELSEQRDQVEEGQIPQSEVDLADDDLPEEGVGRRRSEAGEFNQELKKLISEGNNQLESNQYDAALKKANRALDIDDESYEAHLLAGEALNRMNRRMDAIEHLTKALELKPEDPKLMARRADVYRMLGQYEAAINDIDRALEIKPESGANLALRADLHRMEGEYELAIAKAAEAAEKANDDKVQRFALGTQGAALVAVGQQDEAEEAIEKALKIDADYDFARLIQARILKEKGDWGGAISKALEVSGGGVVKAEAFRLVGDVMAERGEVEAAIKHYTEALKLDPNDVSTLSARAFSFMRADRYDDAMRDVLKGLEQDPDSLWLKTLRTMIYTKVANTMEEGEAVNDIVSQQ